MVQEQWLQLKLKLKILLGGGDLLGGIFAVGGLWGDSPFLANGVNPPPSPPISPIAKTLYCARASAELKKRLIWSITIHYWENLTTIALDARQMNGSALN